MGEHTSPDEVTDADLKEEIELLGEVIAATTGCLKHLTASEVDEALGVGKGSAGVTRQQGARGR